MADISVRPVREDDAAAIVALLDPIIRAGTHTVMTDPGTPDEQVAFIRGLPARSVYTVAIGPGGGPVLGVQDVRPVSNEPARRHVGEISTFVALAAHRGGIGRCLTAVTLAAAATHGFRKIVATIRADNPAAIAFYRSRGFEVIGTARRHAVVHGRSVDAVLTERWIE